MNNFSNLKPSIRLSIVNPKSESKSVIGPGIVSLCKGISDTGSLNAAAKRMRMAYSKAWRIMRDTEKALGVKLLERNGAHGSTLTDDCKKLIATYDAIASNLQHQAEMQFNENLGML